MNQNAKQDDNQYNAMIAHTGTAGTAETVRVVASSDGALRVDLVAGDTINIGTMTVGTVDMLKAGTITKVEGGSIAVTAGTAIVTNGSIVVTNGTVGAGSIVVTAGTIASGSIAVIAGTGIVSSGSISVIAGTGIVTSGSIAVIAGTGIVTGGSIAVTAGTVYGTITNIDEDYDIRIDESATGTTYYGYAAPGQGTNTAGTVWKIMQKVYSSTASAYLFADGDKNFNNIWDNRSSLTYS